MDSSWVSFSVKLLGSHCDHFSKALQMLAGGCTHVTHQSITAARSVRVARLHKPKCRRPLIACGLSEQEELQQTPERGQGQPHSHTMQSSVLYSKLTLKAVAGVCSKETIRSTE